MLLGCVLSKKKKKLSEERGRSKVRYCEMASLTSMATLPVKKPIKQFKTQIKNRKEKINK
jgi:hypothetical protein